MLGDTAPQDTRHRHSESWSLPQYLGFSGHPRSFCSGWAEPGEEQRDLCGSSCCPSPLPPRPLPPCPSLAAVPGAATHAQTRRLPKGWLFLSFLHGSRLCALIERSSRARWERPLAAWNLEELGGEKRCRKGKKPENNGRAWYRRWSAGMEKLAEDLPQWQLREDLVPSLSAPAQLTPSE